MFRRGFATLAHASGGNAARHSGAIAARERRHHRQRVRAGRSGERPGYRREDGSGVAQEGESGEGEGLPRTPVCYPTDGSPDSGLPELIAMNTTAKIQHKGQVTIPTSVRRQAGLSKGDLVNFAFQRGKIVITPRLVIDRSQFPNADDEYTPAQRRIIDARLDKAEKGPSYGPFNTADEMIAHMKGELKKRAAAKKSKRVG